MKAVWLKIKPWLGLVGVLLVGVLLGSVLTTIVLNRFQEGPPRRGPEMFLEKLDEEVGLQPEQRVKILGILKSCEPKIQQINLDKNLAIARIFEESRQQIRATLTAGQQVKYDEFMKVLRERWERERGRRDHPDGDRPGRDRFDRGGTPPVLRPDRPDGHRPGGEGAGSPPPGESRH
jgi:hypothetical protein